MAFGFLRGAWVGPGSVMLPPPPSPACADRESWGAAVRDALAAIDRGRFDKVVLGRAARTQAPAGRRLSPADVAATLAARRPDAHVFVVPTGRDSAYVGATPELLAEVRGRTVRTHALAGTAPAELGGELLRSGKDLHEHGLVVRAVAGGLAALTESLDVAARPGLRRAGGVVHLETPVVGRLRPGVGLLDVAAALHPTPAMAGWPHRAARAWLLARESFPASLYRGLVGELRPDGDGELYAAIRMAHVAPEGAVLWAGAGIVAGSDPDREWDETEWKLEALREVLA